MALSKRLLENVAATQNSTLKTDKAMKQRVNKKIAAKPLQQGGRNVYQFSKDRKVEEENLNGLGTYLVEKKYNGQIGKFDTRTIEANVTGSNYFTAQFSIYGNFQFEPKSKEKLTVFDSFLFPRRRTQSL